MNKLQTIVVTISNDYIIEVNDVESYIVNNGCLNILETSGSIYYIKKWQSCSLYYEKEPINIQAQTQKVTFDNVDFCATSFYFSCDDIMYFYIDNFLIEIINCQNIAYVKIPNNLKIKEKDNV